MAPEDNKALEKKFKKDILALGKLAWKCLLNDRHCFREDQLKELESRNKTLVAHEVGLLYKEESLKRLKPQHEYYFLHKSFQEYLAASYVAHKLRRKQFNLFEHLSFDNLVKKYPQVFLFVSGILGEKASILFTQIGEKLKGSGHWDWYNCSKEDANFFTESCSESGNAELMAVTLCSFIPLPLTVEIPEEKRFLPSSSFTVCHGFLQVLRAWKGFSKLQTPVALSVKNKDDLLSFDDVMERIVPIMESCSQLRTVSLSIPFMEPSSVNCLLKGLSANRCLSEFSLKVPVPSAYQAQICNGLAAHQTLTKLTLALPGTCSEACFDALDTGLSADTPLTSIGVEVYGPVSSIAIRALGKMLSNKSLESLSLAIYGDMQDSLAVALMEALAGQNGLKSLDLCLNGKLSFSGANFLEKGLLENSSLNDLRVVSRGELPGNWQSVVRNLCLAKKALVSCAFYPNTWVKVTGNQMAHFRPPVVEKRLVPTQHLTVNIWGELSCEGMEAFCEVLVRYPLSSLTLNFHGKLTDGVANCIARCLKPHKALSSLTINIWGELTTEGSTVLQVLSDNNLSVRIKEHDVCVDPDESINDLDVSIDSPASLKLAFSKVKNTRNEKLSLTINNESGAIKDWTHHLGDALTENRSLTALDLTINNYMMNADLGKRLGESMLRSTSLTSFSLTINNCSNMTGGWYCTLGDSLSKMTSLTTLSLAINDDSEANIFRGKGLYDSLIAMKSLSTLSLSIEIMDSNLNEFWSNVLRNCLERNTSLEKLCLTVVDFTCIHPKEHWMSGLRDGLVTTRSLNELTLTINNIAEEDYHLVEHIRECLSGNKLLTTLTVTVNSYWYSTCDYCQHLWQCLTENNCVTTLTFTWNDYSKNKEFSELPRFPLLGSENTSLTTLNLTVNSCKKGFENWLLFLCPTIMEFSSLTKLRLQVNNHCATSGSIIYDLSKLLQICISLSLLDLTVSFYGNENEC